MEWRERRVAQIVRDFMEAYVLAAQIGERLRAGDLDYHWVKRLVGESEESPLFRLKEESHALFRFDKEGSAEELQAEELFDLAVGALFHEAMKFREGYYLTTSYSPRAERLMHKVPGPLAPAFRRELEAGRQRMLESEVEASQLFDRTRDQLVSLLRQMPQSGQIARSLVEDSQRTEQVFGVDLGKLLGDIYGAAGTGYWLAIQNLIEKGHFSEAAALLEREDVQRAGSFCENARRFTAGMQRYYAGDFRGALEALEEWGAAGAGGPDAWRCAARRALEALIDDGPEPDAALAERARPLLDELRR